jgi:hypothetical protein
MQEKMISGREEMKGVLPLEMRVLDWVVET